VRKCTKPEQPDIRFYYLCTECFPKVSSQDDVGRLRKFHYPARKERNKKRSKLAYPIIGGPLDGEHAITDDMSSYGEALYKEVAREYVEFNAAGGSGGKRIGGFPPSMIYVHKSVLKPLISARTR